MEFAFYLLIGALAGTLAGLFGVGGGVIVVPALAMVFTHFGMPQNTIMQMAIGTSLAVMILTMAAALRVHTKYNSVRWDMIKKMFPSLLTGVIVGSSISGYLSSNWLSVFFGIFLIFLAFRFVFAKPIYELRRTPTQFVIYCVAFLIGMLSSILGIGGGVLIVPFLLRCQLNAPQAAGTAVVCGLGIAIMATLCFMWLGRGVVTMDASTGYIYWLAFVGVAMTSIVFAGVGTHLAMKLPATITKPIFALLLLVVAIHLLLPFVKLVAE
jgi:uncharacterized membrane protein YfcA